MRQRPAGAHKMDSAKPSVRQFIVSCYTFWQEGCNCQMCEKIELFERGERDDRWLMDRMTMYLDLYGGHVDAH